MGKAVKTVAKVATGGLIGFATGGVGGAVAGGLIGASRKPLKTAAHVGGTVVGALGGPIGAGIGRTVTGLATGEKFKQAAISGLTAGIVQNYAPEIKTKVPGVFGSISPAAGAIAKTIFTQAATPLIASAASEGITNYIQHQKEKAARQKAMMQQREDAYRKQEMVTFNTQQEAIKHSEALAKISASNIARMQKLIADYRAQRSDEIQGKKPKTGITVPAHADIGEFEAMPPVSERKMNETHKDNKVETWLESARYLSQRSNRFGDVTQAIYDYVRNRGRKTLSAGLQGGA